MSRYRLTYHRFEMSDTGIGKSLGYADDKTFRRAYAMKLAVEPPEIRQAVEDMRKQMLRSLMFGEPPPDET